VSSLVNNIKCGEYTRPNLKTKWFELAAATINNAYKTGDKQLSMSKTEGVNYVNDSIVYNHQTWLADLSWKTLKMFLGH